MLYDNTFNFYDVCNSAESHFAKVGKGKGSGYKQYQVWKYLNESKFYPSGNRMIDKSAPYNQFQKLEKELDYKNNKSINLLSKWKPLGPFEILNVKENYTVGLGKIITFEVNRKDENQIYIASDSGGLWRTKNGGLNWEYGTDFLPSSGVNKISANPTNFDTVLINVVGPNIHNAFGIYASNNGGMSFEPTNFIPSKLGLGSLEFNFNINVLKYHPLIPNLVFVGTNMGLYRSTDNLKTWTKLLGDKEITQIEFHPSNENIIYINDVNWTTKHQVLRSTDKGITFKVINGLPDVTDYFYTISTTNACKNCVFVANSNSVWRSSDDGNTFSLFFKSDKGTLLFKPNDANADRCLLGGVDMYNSLDAGKTVNQITDWFLGSLFNGNGSVSDNYKNSKNYVHADVMEIASVNNNFYVSTDGFLCKSQDNGLTWQKLTKKLNIRENYCLGVSQSNTNIAICGSQDNGVSVYNEGEWIEAYGADGTNGIIHPLNPDFKIGSIQNGYRVKLLGKDSSKIEVITPTDFSGDWVSPMFYDPNDQFSVYTLGNKIYKSTIFGGSWKSSEKPTSFTDVISRAAIAENNSKTIVVTSKNKIEISTNGGTSFKSIATGLPNLIISSVKFDPKNDSTIIVTYDSYLNNNNRVFITKDQGKTWQNITYNLGILPIHSVVIDNTNDSNIYLGAEIGIYRKAMNSDKWELFNNSLPNAAILDLGINHGDNSLKAVTWGRGLWEAKLFGRESYPGIQKTEITNPPTFDLPKFSVPQYVTSKINYSGTLSKVYVAWAVNAPNFNATNVIPMSLNSTSKLWVSNSPLPTYPAGTKMFFKVIATGSNNDTSETYKFMYEVRQNTLSNDEYNLESNISIYPNPFNQELSIVLKNNTQTYQYEIVNLLNQSILKGEIIEFTKLNVSNLSSGTYIIKFNNGKDNIIKKVFKY